MLSAFAFFIFKKGKPLMVIIRGLPFFFRESQGVRNLLGLLFLSPKFLAFFHVI